MRDDFTMPIKETLAKRVAFHCSNPQCRRSTSGPKLEPGGSVNIGVASHIAAASEGGPRYDSTMTPEQRRSLDNGIWLCQNCGKLVDDDEIFHTTEILHMWRILAEATASREMILGRYQNTDVEVFAKLEKLLPELLAEMREDIKANPTDREIVLLSTNWIYNSDKPYLAYHYEKHPNLENKMHVLVNQGLARDITYNNVKRYVISETLAEYLLATAG